MLFTTYIYLLLFLPISVLGYTLLRQRSMELSLGWLNLCSFFFYAWWNPAYLPLLLASITANFFLGKTLSREKDSLLGKRLLFIGITLNLGLLGYFKYTNFALANINTLLGTQYGQTDIILPLAISFFSFNQIAFLIDASEGLAKEYRFNHYCLFVSFFPHLLAGPIVHHGELIPQFSDLSKKPTPWAAAITIISFGLFKKVIFADNLGYYADQVFGGMVNNNGWNATDSWIGALCFTLQIYFDFSAYCDIAYGSALLFGIQLPQNFLSPFKTANIIDFWKCWHMTLSRFITSYIYTPLLRNTPGTITFTKAMIITIASMTLVGLWHGAGWNYVCFGLVHGVMLSVNHVWRKLRINQKLASVSGYHTLCVVITFVLVMLSLVLFRAHDLSSALTLYQHMFNLNDMQWTHHLYQPTINDLCQQLRLTLNPMLQILPILLLLLAWVWILPNLQQIMAGQPYAICNLPITKSKITWQANTTWTLITAIALVIGLLAVNQTATFIYFQF